MTNRGLFVIPLIALSLLTCDFDTENQNASGLAIRASLQTLNAGNTEARVMLEGPDGNSVTGGTVIFRTRTNVVKILDYDFSKGVYHGFLPPSSGGVYSIEVNSRLLPGLYTQPVPHHILTERPAITLLSDHVSSALVGQPLRRDHEILIGWSSIPDATVYQVLVTSGVVTVYAGSTSDTSLVIPAGTFSATGLHAVSVKAQYIRGDPVFRRHNYYSMSDRSGITINFTLE